MTKVWYNILRKNKKPATNNLIIIEILIIIIIIIIIAIIIAINLNILINSNLIIIITFKEIEWNNKIQNGKY